MTSVHRAAAGISLVVLASLICPAPALAAMRTSAAEPALPCAQPMVDEPIGGQAAVRELGANLSDAAANVDQSPAAYRTLLRTDATMRVDECGQTFVVEPTPTPGELATAAEGDVPAGAARALDATGDPFALNSRPGSLRTIYLDFNGQRLVGTGWNASTAKADLQATPYDSDGDTTTFSPAELDVVRGAWAGVAEDYAPFDVNVTTQDPGQAAITRDGVGDEIYGTRAVITSADALKADICGSCGGIAFLNAFDSYLNHSLLQPALIFAKGPAWSGKNVGEAVSHEVGHNLGLHHDGKVGGDTYYAGQGPWSPIMGVGYYTPASQWSQGEYAAASNREDDLAIMAGHGVTPMQDDHGDAAPTATTLAVDGSPVAGLIGTRADTDWFAFTVADGTVATTVRVAPQAVGADLDASLTLRDATGATVVSVDPPAMSLSASTAGGLDATVTRPLAPGAYTAQVDGVGFADPLATGYSDYGSLGRYTITVSPVIAPLAPPASSAPVAPVSGAPAPTTPVAAAPSSPPTPASTTFSGPLRAAVAALPVHAETTSAYAASRFPLVDADRDCRTTRTEVLQAESRLRLTWTTTRHCTVTGGSWASLFDHRISSTGAAMTAVWTVPLAEAWQSGARGWSTARRQAFANDLADTRTLLAVTVHSARARADREPTQWLPPSASRCTYVADWVAVKLRWGLTTDSTEQAHLVTLAKGCATTAVTVHRV